MANEVGPSKESSDIRLQERDLKLQRGAFSKRAMNDKPGLGTTQANSSRQKVPDVIVIEDDDIDSEVENLDAFDEVEYCDKNFDSDTGSMKLPSYRESTDDSSGAGSELSDSSDDEDCLVMEPGPRMSWPLHQRVYRAEKRPAYNLRRSSSKDSSDCEIVEDPFGKVRQDWEEAALRKRLGTALNTGRYKADSEGSTSASNHINIKQSTTGKQKGDVQHEQEQSKDFQSCPSDPLMSEGSKFANTIPATLDQQDSNDVWPDARLEGDTELAGEGTSLAGNTSTSSGNDAESLDERASVFHMNTATVGSNDDTYLPQEKAAEAAVNPICEGLVVDRERMKETEEFRHAEEEEWAKRQLELHRQAQEAQRQRKRRRVEAERRIEMESRQRQRLEEIRQSQEKEEQNLDYKEKVRDRIRSELEHMAAACIDMATLLRHLGIQVDGGAFPTAQQVNSAYKKALLRFHPDRVAVMARSDPSHQVEAEETFKLISKMKDTLRPVFY